MRINKFLAFRKWIPTAMAMGPMLRSLYQHPEHGFLGVEMYYNLRGIVLIQYWRSFEDLEKFARDKSEPHLSAWKRFNKAIGSDGSVGIWHETYLVNAGKYEVGLMPDATLPSRSEEHTSELQSPDHLVCRLLLEKKKQKKRNYAAPRRGSRAINGINLDTHSLAPRNPMSAVAPAEYNRLLHLHCSRQGRLFALGR